MIRNILVIAGFAGAFAGAASAQTPPPATPMQAAPPAMTQPSPAPQARQFTPGASVVASDGAQLGVIDRVHVGAAGDQMLHVRAEDGTIKAVPSTGATVRDGTVAVAWTEAEFEAAPAAPAPMTDAMPAPAPRNPGAMPPPPTAEDKPDAADPPADPPAQPRA